MKKIDGHQYVLLLVLLTTGCSEGYSDGAPNESCDSMDPSDGHDAFPQNTQSPYKVEVSVDHFVRGTPVEVTLSSPSGKSLSGFLLQARRQNNEKVGSFEPVNNTQVVCEGFALTHENSDLTLPMIIKWIPPTTSTGDVQFRATFVLDESTYWINVMSIQLADNSPPVQEITTTADKPKKTTLRRVEECGQSIGCYDDCKDSGCSFAITWNEDNDAVDLTIKMDIGSKENQWAAVAFSEDKLMGDDSVIECVSLGDEIKVFQSYNNGRKNKRLENPLIGLTVQSSSLKDGILECQIKRDKKVSDEKAFDLNSDWYILVTYGDTLQNFVINNHDSSITWSTDDAVDFQKMSEVVGVQTQYPLIKAHGILMVISWMITSGIGLVVARYMKPYWPNSMLSGQKVWFQLHRGCMVLTLVISSVGFALVFIDAKGYSEIVGPNYKKAHPIIGIIVTILVYGNAFMSYYRTPPGTPNRPLFNRAHFGIGFGSYVLALICIFFGVQLSKCELPDSSLDILTAYCTWVAFAYIIMELIPYIPQRESKTFDLEMTNAEEVQKTPPPKTPPNLGLKKFVLFLHIVIVIGLSVVIIALIAVN